MDQEKLHVAIIASPGLGHLIPVLLLGNHLATHHHLHVIILSVTTQISNVESQLLCFLTDSAQVNIIKIPIEDISNLLQPDDKFVTQISVMMRKARECIPSAIYTMSNQPHVLIGDLYEFHLQKYVYIPCNARFVALTTYCHVLDKEVKGQYVVRIEPLMILGCIPVRCEDVPDPMLDSNNQQYYEYVRMGIDFATLSDGILINTWRDIESISLEALKYNETLRSVVKVPIYDI